MCMLLLLLLCCFFIKFVIINISYLVLCATDRQWQQVNYNSAQPHPSPRAHHVQACYNNFIYIYGGVQEENSTTNTFNDLWKFDTVAGTWTSVAIQTSSPSDVINQAAGAASTVSGTIWFIYGGNAPNQINGNLYTFDFTTETFHECQGCAGGGLFLSSVGCMTTINNQFWQFGGSYAPNVGTVSSISPSCQANQIYGPSNMLDFSDSDLTEVSPDPVSGTIPAGTGHLCFPDLNNVLIFFMGCQPGVDNYNYGQIFQASVGNIENFPALSGVSNSPPNTFRNFATGVNNNRVSVIFGGWQVTNTSNTVSFYSNVLVYHAATSSWEYLTTVGPSGRKGAGSCRIGSTMYMFGGLGQDPVTGNHTSYNDLWSISVHELGYATRIEIPLFIFIFTFILKLFL